MYMKPLTIDYQHYQAVSTIPCSYGLCGPVGSDTWYLAIVEASIPPQQVETPPPGPRYKKKKSSLI